jgi:glycosyltransferase involved in cell wall biosynthesis
LCQLPSDCELIVVDDGSDDGTARRLAAYDGTREGLRVFYREHRGASGARNAGLSAARGEYVTFIDCDDCMQPGFLPENLPAPAQDADLYIFGIERFPLSGVPEKWTVSDRVYRDAAAFADEYVRVRQLMIYSNCNKFYRRSVIEDLGLRFDENVVFGEDRLFNYRFLTGCGRVATSSQIMLRYIQRSDDSMSARHVPRYFEQVMELHRAKIRCFLSLSTGTTEEERRTFAARDLAGEIGHTVERFPAHPGEEAENMPAVNALVFGAFPELGELLREKGVSDSALWHRTDTGRRLVLEYLRNADPCL